MIKQTWQRLRSPSAKWSVLALVVTGVVVGFVLTVGTQVAVYVTGTDKFCGGACHSMQWVAKEHGESVHMANRTGVHAGCHDCHIPATYPANLIYKTKAGIKDIIGEMRGIISTEADFKKMRLEMAKEIWEEYRANGSENCRNCHTFTPAVLAKQKEFARPMHEAVLAGNGTCIDCHKGVGHAAPEE